jgi:type IV secretion system protein VirB9
MRHGLAPPARLARAARAASAAITATAALAALACSGPALAARPAAEPPQAGDPRIKTVVYSPDSVVTLPVRRGMVTQIVLAEDETAVGQPAMGKGSDCAREGDTWCVIASGRDVFVKPKTGATANNMALVSTRRRYAFAFDVVSDAAASHAVMRVSMALPPAPRTVAAAASGPVTIELGPPPMTARELVANRMRSLPAVRNKDYSVAVGERSEDIVPAMVFDDGTKTYFKFPNNRPLPTVFESLGDRSEEMVNAHMEGDQLVADRVARRFVLRLGNSVAAVINEAFDIDGVAPLDGTTVPGVQRVLRSAAASPASPTGVPAASPAVRMPVAASPAPAASASAAPAPSASSPAGAAPATVTAIAPGPGAGQ